MNRGVKQQLNVIFFAYFAAFSLRPLRLKSFDFP